MGIEIDLVLMWGSKLASFFYADPKSLVCCVSIEIDLVFVRVVGIDLISAWGIEIDLVSAQR